MTSAFRIGSLRHFPGFGAGSVRPLMRPEGTGSSRIMLMGEALGEHEERDQLPFRPQAEAGSVLERALHRAGLPRESLTITNLVWYRPPRNWLDGAPWQFDAIRACAPLNAELVALRAPKVIVALGGLAMAELTGLAGEKAGILNTRGFVVPSLLYPGIPIVGTYHPSFLRRGSKERQEAGAKGKTEAAGGGTQGMALLGVLIRDLLLAQQIVREGAPRFEYDSYALGASIEDWRSALEELRRDPARMISYDFETIDTFAAADESEAEIIRREPTQVQISWRPGQALVSSWTPELVPILRALLELPNPKIDWNGRKFDRPILRELGIRTDLGIWHDGMDLWHHAQPDLPRGLQFAASFHVPEVGPWKHLSLAAPLWYGALDADMPLRIFGGLRATLSSTREAHSGVSLFEGYADQVVHVAPVLDRMTVRGIPVDENERLALDAEFAQTLVRTAGECQPLVPDELKPLSPKNGFVRAPAELMILCAVCDGKKKLPNPAGKGKLKCAACGGAGKVRMDALPAPFVERDFTVDVKCVCEGGLDAQTGLACEACTGTGKIRSTRKRIARLEEFKPGSWQQVLRYIEFRMAQDIEARAKKRFLRSGDPEESRMWAEKTTDWYVPWNDRENRPTTAAAELERLARRTGDALLPKVLEFKEIATARGTFVEGWKPGPDGRVHANFGFKPATPQLSSDSPNVQNFPNHSDLAQRMKRMIRASGARRFVKFDWKSFHVVTGGFEAQDAQYIRIARIDMHSFLTLVGLLKLEAPEIAFGWSDAELKDRLAWHRKQPKAYAEYARTSWPGGMTFGQIRDYIAKRVVFGWEFGQGSYSLWKLWQETFASPGEAGKCQEVMRSLFPKLDQWQFDVRMRADRDHQLVTRFGHVRRFWDVFERRPVGEDYQPRGNERVWIAKSNGTRWLLKPGDDHEAVVAYLPAADAFGMKRRVLRKLGELGWDSRYGLVCDVHDDLRFETERVDECIADVKPLMEAPCEALIDPIVAPGGLWVEAEAAVGKDWASWVKVG